jgi:hypothetical protein
LIQIEQLKLQFMREQHELEKRRHEEEKLKEEKKEDERILAIDLDACALPDLSARNIGEASGKAPKEGRALKNMDWRGVLIYSL